MDELFTAASARGHVRHGTLTSHRSFSFGTFHDPARMGFGALRAVNEEVLAPGAGVPLHAHENIEIVSLPLSGSLRHQDSRGASHVIAPGEVHLLSAGRGITHWEYNHSAREAAHYLQLWIHPRAPFTPARYAQGRIDAAQTQNRFACIAAPMNGIVQLDQDAWISLARCEGGVALHYAKRVARNGLYFFMIEGGMQAGGYRLERGDALALLHSVPELRAFAPTTLLAIEVPLADYHI